MTQSLSTTSQEFSVWAGSENRNSFPVDLLNSRGTVITTQHLTQNDITLIVAFGAGSATGSYLNLRPSSIEFSNGNAGLIFSAPGEGNTGVLR